MTTAQLDDRFSAPTATALSWDAVDALLGRAELYWLTTVRSDGRPHVTPLVGVYVDGAVHFVTGGSEQKARNLEHDQRVVVTTGTNTWAKGIDVVVEGTAVRVSDGDALRRVAAAIEAKYGSDWHFDVGDGMFHEPGREEPSLVFRVGFAKVIAFAKDPHGQTTYRFST